MGLLLEPHRTVPLQIEDVEFQIRVLTSREVKRVLEHLLPLQRHFDQAKDDDPTADVELGGELLDHMEKVILIGTAALEDATVPMTEEDLDRVPFHAWETLYAEIVKVNFVTEEESKN